jgi:DNA-binding transcriptional regulator YiaG
MVLKAEISRISRKEAKSLVNPVRRAAVGLRSAVATLRKQVSLLLSQSKQQQTAVARIEKAQPAPAPTEEQRGWISGKGVRSLRNRLSLSQADFAKLIGVSAMTVYQWEKKSGMIKFRGGTKAKVFAVRDIGARDAKARLAEMDKKPRSKPARKNARKKK